MATARPIPESPPVISALRPLITGGDSGIGRAVAIAYAREGADVVINYLPEEQPFWQIVDHYIRTFAGISDGHRTANTGIAAGNQRFTDSGIGRAVAIAYAREGADVVINYLPEEQPDADEVSP
jgi:NAD(P)-dependent dehydrogenase (short-subunit alcohol dehydrogenase family)